VTSFSFTNSFKRWLLSAFVLIAASSANAGIFEDEEARKAILDLRQKVESFRKESDQKFGEQAKQHSDEISQLRRSLLELQNQLEASNAEMAKLRGQDEQLRREFSDLQRQHLDVSKSLDERLRKVEPAKISMDGLEFLAEAAEKKSFEASLAVFRKGDFAEAQTAFNDFLNRNAQSGYVPAAIFWLGNAQFISKDYKGALQSFRKLVAQAPMYQRIPEAQLAMANCQLELKDTRGAKKTLENILEQHPRSEAADAAKERLARLK
jgi:tol-pal system protein YbgF